jgi:2-keto-4-pentenoate hydratase
MGDEIGTVARELAAARREGRLTAPVDDALIPDLERAYALQGAAVSAFGARRVGYKLGATGTESQAKLNVSGPFHAPLFEPLTLESGSTLTVPPGLRGIEVELAFRIGRALPARDGGYGPHEVADAVASLHPALEVVATREDRSGLEGRHAVADFGLNHAFVHGSAIDGWRDLDLPGVAGRCLVDGVVKAEGTAEVVLGSPLLALAWLTRQGIVLAAGDWISTGTLTGITPAAAGQRVTGDLGPLGRVELVFAA